jgi:phage gpG-like protein
MNVRKNEAVIGTNLRYAKFHQYGTTKMPKRQIVFEPKGFADELGQRALRWISKGTI